MTDDTDDTADVQNPYRIGDPVMDAAQGRAMIVLDAPDVTVAEWSDRNGYDLERNYANEKFEPNPNEPVVECVYVSDVRSEPSKSYTFPVSRVRLIDAHHADDGGRIADRVTVAVLEALFAAAYDDPEALDLPSPATVGAVAQAAGIDVETIDRARELASVEETVVADE